MSLVDKEPDSTRFDMVDDLVDLLCSMEKNTRKGSGTLSLAMTITTEGGGLTLFSTSIGVGRRPR